MSLPNGTRLGAYEIVSLLGAGGMGEVYRARDSKLGREVAIKLKPQRRGPLVVSSGSEFDARLSPAGTQFSYSSDHSGRPGAARRLFAAAEWLDFDVTRDGRFIAIVETARSGEQPLTVILNWQPGS